jgi:ABC-type lipoprotein export system ATPase subunit
MQTLQLTLSHVRKGFERPVLTDINLSIDNTSYISILGKSGSGKSTLMNILGLVEDRDDGEFSFNGKNIEKGKDYSALRKASIGFIFLDGRFSELFKALRCDTLFLIVERGNWVLSGELVAFEVENDCEAPLGISYLPERTD